MNVSSFKDMYVAELQEARSFEEQLTKALPDLVEKASDSDLKEALKGHLKTTRTHLDRVNGILQRHGSAGETHTDNSMKRLISETEKWADMVDDSDQRDAGLIGSAQRIEHYEIAVYGTLAAWAKQLGFDDDKQELHSILEEEREADEKLTRLAEREVNPAAA
jgi:ferritin-like metal-binding protein YciE